MFKKANVSASLNWSYCKCVVGKDKIQEHVLALGNFDNEPSISGSCKNLRVSCKPRGGMSLHPDRKKKERL